MMQKFPDYCTLFLLLDSRDNIGRNLNYYSIIKGNYDETLVTFEFLSLYYIIYLVYVSKLFID
jgi:hypothetical protein